MDHKMFSKSSRGKISLASVSTLDIKSATWNMKSINLIYGIYPAIRWGFCPYRMTSNN